MDEYGHNTSSDEFGKFVNACLTIFSSLAYCYFISRNIPKGFPRLLTVLPVIYIFALIPLNLYSFHFTFVLGYYISWLASFKLVLFSFDKGPLSSDPTLASSSSPLPMTFVLFLGIACLPIQVKQPNQSSVNFHAPYYYVLEGILLGLVFYIYWFLEQNQYEPNFIISNTLYLFHSCFGAELSLVIYAVLARLLLGVEVDAPFGSYVYFSTSFSDFWGKRWNVMTSNILRSIVYEPVRHIFKRSWGVYIAIVVTFFVSGLLHELLIFYVFREQPCWDVCAFFTIHGIGAAVENKLKRYPNRKWRLNNICSIVLMDLFLVCSAFCLLFPFFERFKFPAKVVEEIANFMKLPVGGNSLPEMKYEAGQ